MVSQWYGFAWRLKNRRELASLRPAFFRESCPPVLAEMRCHTCAAGM
jgi:hypothetical protein